MSEEFNLILSSWNTRHGEVRSGGAEPIRFPKQRSKSISLGRPENDHYNSSKLIRAHRVSDGVKWCQMMSNVPRVWIISMRHLSCMSKPSVIPVDWLIGTPIVDHKNPKYTSKYKPRNSQWAANEPEFWSMPTCRMTLHVTCQTCHLLHMMCLIVSLKSHVKFKIMPGFPWRCATKMQCDFVLKINENEWQWCHHLNEFNLEPGQSLTCDGLASACSDAALLWCLRSYSVQLWANSTGTRYSNTPTTKPQNYCETRSLKQSET